MTMSKEAVEAAAYAYSNVKHSSGHLYAMEAALTAALPHLLAAKDAQIAALLAEGQAARDALIEFSDKHGKIEAELSECLRKAILRLKGEDHHMLRSRARAALEMSGGVL